jgi:hypothetical protein
LRNAAIAADTCLSLVAVADRVDRPTQVESAHGEDAKPPPLNIVGQTVNRHIGQPHARGDESFDAFRATHFDRVPRLDF